MVHLQEQQREVVETLCNYIPRLVDGIEKLKIAFQQGNEQLGYEFSTQVIEGYTWVIDAITVINNLNHTKISLADTTEIVTELLGAFDNKDTLLICDVMEYAITEQLENWLETLKVMVER